MISQYSFVNFGYWQKVNFVLLPYFRKDFRESAQLVISSLLNTTYSSVYSFHLCHCHNFILHYASQLCNRGHIQVKIFIHIWQMQCPSRHRCSVGDHSVLSDDFWPSGRLFFSLEIAPGPLAGASAFLVVFLFRNSSWPSGRRLCSLGGASF